MLHGQAFRSARKLLIIGASLAWIALLLPQARSLDKSPDSLKVGENTSFGFSSGQKIQSLSDQGFRPVPPNRLNLAKHSINKKRNPFLINSSLGVDAEASLSGETIAAGLSSLRLAGIVQEGSTLMALVEDGSTHNSLSLGAPFNLGGLQGLGFRLVSISFDQGSISISNGRVEHQIFVSQ